jgi:hypothetical protein
MKTLIFLCAAAFAVFSSVEGHARDTRHEFAIAGVMENEGFANRLEGVSFYFGEQNHPAIKENFGEFRTNKKTNAFGKSDLEACQWVMLSALVQLHVRARSLGADAVINIRSNYKNREFTSETHYICGAGGLMAGVALIGDIVDLE